MQTILFRRPPADVTLGEALAIGARYWAGSWDRWVLAVAAVGLATGLVGWLFPAPELDQATMQSLLVRETAADPSILPRLFAGPLAISIVGLVADWFLAANAIAGLRGREVTLRWVLAAGLRVLAVLLGLSLIATAGLTVLALLGPIGVLAALAAIPLLVYFGIRLTFWELGLFDGKGIEDSLRTSWSLTNRAVLRVLGWSLALLGLSLVLVVGETVLLAALPGARTAIRVGASLAGAGLQAFAVIVIAILYESQRLRTAALAAEGLGGPASWRSPLDPGRPAPPPGWGEPPDQDPPTAPPPPPPSPPHGPWRG